MDTSGIQDPDVQLLAGLAAALEPEYVSRAEVDMWSGSPFRWINTRPSRRVSSRASVWRSSSRHFGPITRSTSFQQIRDQDYDFCFCIGVSPFDVHAWFIPKVELTSDRPPTLVPQHGGAAGRDTKWLSFAAAAPPEWLKQYGGRLSDVADLIRAVETR